MRPPVYLRRLGAKLPSTPTPASAPHGADAGAPTSDTPAPRKADVGASDYVYPHKDHY